MQATKADCLDPDVSFRNLVAWQKISEGMARFSEEEFYIRKVQFLREPIYFFKVNTKIFLACLNSKTRNETFAKRGRLSLSSTFLWNSGA